MPTDTALLTLTQWLSPAYPIGAFAYSHGLEAAVDLGWVTGPSGFEDWLCDVLESGAGRADALLLAAAYNAPGGEALREVDMRARAFASSRERLEETSAQGAAFCKVTDRVWGTGHQGLTYPVAVGASAAFAAVPLELTAQLYLQAFASNLIAAAQRLLPLGQTDGQAILQSLSPLFLQISEDAADGDLTRLSNTALLADIAAMRHETQASRIFRT